MSLRKILTIAWKDVRGTFTDRNLILIMLAAPLAISTIIGLTFGGVSQGAAPLKDIPIAVVNLDEGTGEMNYGNIVANILAPLPEGEASDDPLAQTGNFNANTLAVSGIDTQPFTCPQSVEVTSGGAMQTSNTPLDELLEGVRVSSPEEARAGVESGLYTVAVIIPATFSSDVGYTPTDQNLTPTTIQVYADPAKPISSSIVRSIVEQVGVRLATGNVTLSSLLTPIMPPGNPNPLLILSVAGSQAFAQGISCTFEGVGSPISIDQQTVEGDDFVFNPLVVIGSAQAIFFAIFTANGSASSTIEERKNGTLQRIASTPTPMLAILTGKLLATFLNVLFQLLFLMIALTAVNTLIYGRLEFIWGSNIPLVTVILVAISLGTTGLGAITAAAARNPEQATTIGSVVAIFSAVLGGAFGFQLGGGIQYLSVVYWGSNAFSKLASGNNDILLNALVLTLFGAVTFGIGFMIFARRLRD